MPAGIATANMGPVRLVTHAQEAKTLLYGFSHDILSLANPDIAVHQKCFNFIEAERHTKMNPATSQGRVNGY